MPSGPSTNGFTRRNLISTICFLLVCFVALEIAVRLQARRDEDGNCWYGWSRLKPYHLPVKRLARLVHEYTVSQARKLVYDPDIGWSAQPGRNGNNAQGFYSILPDIAPEPPTNRLRIAIFGPSYAASSFESGWWRAVEKTMNEAGVPAEVLNFGVGGYGTDQAFLRWRKHGVPFHPHIVLFGFTRQTCEKNLNLLRMMEEPDTGIPFMKPRFLLAADQLQLINTPVPVPEDLSGIAARFPEWPLAPYEGAYKAEDYQSLPWRHSLLLALVESRIELMRDRSAAAENYRVDGEAARLTLKIIDQFKQEAEAAGSRFYIVHLPTESDLKAFRTFGKYSFADLLTALGRVAPVIRPEPAMLEVAGGRNLSRYFSDGHYTNEFNPAIGAAVANALLATPEVQRVKK